MKLSEDEFGKEMKLLELLEPGKDDQAMPASMFLSRLKQQTISTQPKIKNSFFKEINLMFNRKYAWITALVLVSMSLSLLSPTVRAAASDFLGLFRVQKFAPISISPHQMALLESIADQGLTPGSLEVLDEPTQQQVDSLDAASQLVGQAVVSSRLLGNADQIWVSDQAAGRLTVDLKSARAILAAADVDPNLLPDSLDGQSVDVTIYSAVTQSWANAGITLSQSASPLIDYPDDVNPAVIGQALLQLLGMSETEAIRLASSIDWANTLLFPIPEQFATFSEVTVQGTSGLAVSSLQGEHTTLMWQKDGNVFIMEGQATMRELVRMANSLQ